MNEPTVTYWNDPTVTYWHEGEEMIMYPSYLDCNYMQADEIVSQHSEDIYID